MVSTWNSYGLPTAILIGEILAVIVPLLVAVAYLTYAERKVLADGLLATVLQHEIDHLDGVLFIDHISKLKRDRVIKKFQKAARLAAGGSHVL